VLGLMRGQAADVLVGVGADAGAGRVRQPQYRLRRAGQDPRAR
jgi:hypothetical protein